ncbi:unnamed protein product [Calypogeia fissa]
MAWKAMNSLAAISDDSSSDSDSEDDEQNSRVGGAAVPQKKKGTEEVFVGVKKPKLGFDELSKHGYSGGPSILHIPAPKQEVGNENWSWSNGKRESGGQQGEESIEERELTRELANEKAMKMATTALAESAFAKQQKADAMAEQRARSFSQKEKRKRDLGQASRGKNYVEEEKRLLRDSGVYSGFDT